MTWIVDPHNPEIWHLDGVKHSDAPCPRRIHTCRTQTEGWTGMLVKVHRCACGGIRVTGHRWEERNSRRSLWGLGRPR